MPSLLRSPKGEKRRKFSGDPEEFRLTLVEHLEELRDRVVRSLFVIGGGWTVGWIYFQPVMGFLNRMVSTSIRSGLQPGQEYHEVFLSATEPFFLKLKLSFLLGLIVSFPVIVMQLWGFIAPALKDNEQKPFKKLAPLSFLLFATGAGFAWMITPSALRWFVSYLEEFPGYDLNQQAGTMIFFILKMLLAFGVGFQVPVVVYGLGLAGLLSADTLLKHWRHGATAIFILSMIVTPSQDPMTMLMMAVPLTLLFMISVYAVRYIQRKPKVEDPPFPIE